MRAKNDHMNRITTGGPGRPGEVEHGASNVEGGAASDARLLKIPLKERAAGITACLVQSARSLGTPDVVRARLQTDRARIDLASLVRGYYAFLEGARRMLSRHPEAEAEVVRFLETISFPGEARLALLDAVGLGHEEAQAPLGEERLGERSQPIAVLAVTDATVRHVLLGGFAVSGETEHGMWPADLAQFLSGADSMDGRRLCEAIRVYARAREIRMPQVLVSSWEVVEQRAPKTLEGARVVARLHKAFAAANEAGDARSSAGEPALARRSCIGPLTRSTPFSKLNVGREHRYQWLTANGRRDPEAPLLDDPTIIELWTRRNIDWILAPYFREPNGSVPEGCGPFLVSMLHLAARTREIGLPTALERTIVREIAERLPQDQSAVDALHRAAAAFGWDTRHIRFMGQRLSDLPAPPGLRSTFDDPGPELGPDVPLEEALLALEKGDVEGLRMSDASLRRLLESAGAKIYEAIAEGRPSMVAAMRLLDRAFAIEAIDRGPHRDGGAFYKLMAGGLPESIFDDPEALEIFTRLLDRADFSPAYLHNWRVLLYRHPPFVRAAERRRALTMLERAPLDASPCVDPEDVRIPPPERIGEETLKGLGKSWTQLWSDRDVRFFSISDEDLKTFPMSGSVISSPRNLGSWLQHWSSREVIKVFARLCELRPEDAQLRTSALQWLRTSLGDETGESIPHILRLARNVDWPIERLFYQRPDQGHGWLLDHPDFPGRKRTVKRRANAQRELARAVSDLEKGDLDDAKRDRLMARLLDRARPGAQLEPLLKTLLSARLEGRIEPARVGAEVLDGWLHVGAVAVLAALATQLTEEEVESALRARGHDESASRTWARIAFRLTQLDDQQLAFACADLRGSPPDFSTLPVRLAFASREPPDEPDASDRAMAELHPPAFARAVLDRALGCKEKGPWLSFLERAVQDRMLDPIEIQRALLAMGHADTGPSWPLAPELVSALVAALDAGDEPLFDEAFERLALYVGAERATAAALPLLYQRDLDQVPPLGEAEDSLDAFELAIGHVRSLAAAETDPADDAGRREWAWIDGLLTRALIEGRVLDEDTVVGIAEGFHARVLSRRTLELAMRAMSPERTEAVRARTRTSDARAAIDGRSRARLIGPTHAPRPIGPIDAAEVRRLSPDRRPESARVEIVRLRLGQVPAPSPIEPREVVRVRGRYEAPERGDDGEG
jgi:hypothetical protein